MYQQSMGEAQIPGGTAFATEELARQHADNENTMPYMRGWSGHKQIVAPCIGMHCRPYTTSHRYDWQGKAEQR